MSVYLLFASLSHSTFEQGLKEFSLHDVMTVLDEIKADIEPITDLIWARSRCKEWNSILRSYFALDSEEVRLLLGKVL